MKMAIPVNAKKNTYFLVLHGGLGNQLFQLFFALLGMEKNKKGFFFISDSALLSYKTQRTLEIDNLLNCCKSYISPIIIKSDLLLKLRLPKHLKYFLNREMRVYVPFYGVILDGYFQELRLYKEHPRERIWELLAIWRNHLYEIGCLSKSEIRKGQLLHIRLSDFFRSNDEARNFVREKLLQLTKETDLVTDQEALVQEELSQLSLPFNVKLLNTKNMTAWKLFSVMSEYEFIETNGSSLAVWAAILSNSEFKTSNLEHQYIHSFMLNLIDEG